MPAPNIRYRCCTINLTVSKNSVQENETKYKLPTQREDSSILQHAAHLPLQRKASRILYCPMVHDRAK